MCTLHELRLDLAAPDKILNRSQQRKISLLQPIWCAVSTNSSSVVEFVQKIEAAAALRKLHSIVVALNFTFSSLQSRRVILSASRQPPSLTYSASSLCRFFGTNNCTDNSAASSWEIKSNSVLALVYQGENTSGKKKQLSVWIEKKSKILLYFPREINNKIEKLWKASLFDITKIPT